MVRDGVRALIAVALAHRGIGVLGLHALRPEGMEAKYANAAMGQGYGDEGTDAIPDHVVIQAQCQMLSARLQRIWVPAAIAGFALSFKLYCVPRDDGVINAVVEQGLAWWERHVIARVPPDVDEPPPIELLKRIR